MNNLLVINTERSLSWNIIAITTTIISFVLLTVLFYSLKLFPLSFALIILVITILFIISIIKFEFIYPILFIIVIFSGITSVIGPFIKIFLIVNLVLIGKNFLIDNEKIIHWSQIHLFIAFYVILVLFSCVFSFDYKSMNNFIYELFRAVSIFFILSEIIILCIRKYGYKFINYTFYAIIFGATIGACATIYYIYQDPYRYYLAKVYSYVVRGRGWLKDPNFLSLSFNTVIALSFIFFKYEKNKILKTLLILCIAFLVIAISLSLSRGGMLGLVFLFLIILYNQRKNKKLIIIFLIIIAIVVVLTGNQLLPRIQSIASLGSSRDMSLSARTLNLRIALRQIIKSPLFGIGLGDFDNSVNHYYTNHNLKYQWTENIWLQVATETGLISLMVFVGIFITSFILLIKARRFVKEKNNIIYLKFIDGLMFAQIAFLLPATFLPANFYFLIWVYWSINIAVIWHVYKGVNDGTNKTDELL